MKRPDLLAGEDLLPVPLQKRSQEKRQRLKTAALALFGEKGYERTSIDEIAARAGLAVGSFYQHFRSKKQLLLWLMDELLDHLSNLDLRPKGASDIPGSLRTFLSRALSADLHYLGVYKAWQEAALSDPDLLGKQRAIRDWTTARVYGAFSLLQQLPGARSGVELRELAQVMDGFFWSFLAQAAGLHQAQLKQWVDSSTHLIYHALFRDPPEGRTKPD